MVRIVSQVVQHPYERSGYGSYDHKKATKKKKTCIYWLRGCCNRPNCRYDHDDHQLSAQTNHHTAAQPKSLVWRNREYEYKKPEHKAAPEEKLIVAGEEKNTNLQAAPKEKLIVSGEKKNTHLQAAPEEKLIVAGEEKNTHLQATPEEKLIVAGEEKNYKQTHLQSAPVEKYVGNQSKAVTGIALLSGSNVLYTGSEDGFVRAWDCNTGKCLSEANLGGEIGCMTTEGPWIFVGFTNTVKAGNTQKYTEHTLSGPKGQVYCLEIFDNMLIAGVQDGSILTWKLDSEGKSFQQGPSLTGHSLAVISMTVGDRKLFTGSVDQSIKVWDLDKLEIIETLTGHASMVMSVVWWNQFVISCSLDKTIKVWGLTENHKIGEIYSRTEEHGLIALKGWKEEKGKPMLLCSCDNNSICLYDLPSFIEKGRIFSKEKVRSIHMGPGGLVFTGDEAGEVKVLKLSPEEEIPTAV